MEEKSVVDELDLFNKSIYKNDFEPQIMRRGEVYYSEDRIKYFKQNENKYTCKVKGTETYYVSITFDENDTDKIKEATCTCPYFTDKEKYCKHIYSVLYKIKCGDNKEKIINEYYQHIESINKMITNATNYIERNSSHFTNSLKEDFVDYGKNTVDRLNSMKESFDKMLYEDNMISMLKQIVNMSAYTKDKIKGYLDQENTSTTTSAPTSTTSSSIKLSDVIAGMLLSDAIDNHIHKDNKKIHIPNGTLANTNITNVSASPTRLLRIKVGISYSSDIRKAKNLMEKMMRSCEYVLPESEIKVLVSELGSSSVDLEGRCTVTTENYWDATWYFAEQIKYIYDEEGIEIPFSQLDVHMK